MRINHINLSFEHTPTDHCKTKSRHLSMWESERTIDVHEFSVLSSLHKAEIINRKSLKRIKHVNGKYRLWMKMGRRFSRKFIVIIRKYGKINFSRNFSYTGKLMRMIGAPDLEKPLIQWVKRPNLIKF